MTESGTILVVDDSPTTSEFIRYLLADAGYGVQVADSGEQALTAIAQALPDLVLLDLCLPKMDGLEVCRRLKEAERTRDLPVIILTALGSGEQRTAGLKAGAVDYLVKPLHNEELLLRVGTQLALRRATRMLHDELRERQRVAVELRQAQANLAALLESTPDFIYSVDLEHRLLTFNTAVADYYRKTYGTAAGIGVPVDKLMPPERAAEWSALYRRAVAEGGFQQDHVLPDGRTIELSFSRVVQNEEIIGVAVFCKDITDRKQAVEALRESEYLYRQLFEGMLNGFAYCRIILEGDCPRDFVYLSTNRAFETLTGLKDVAGRKVSEVIPGILETDPGLIQTYGRVALSGKSESFEVYVASLQMWFAISVYCPEREHFVAVFDVITERKQAEAKLRETRDYLENLIDHAHAPIIVWDPQFRITRFNQAFELLTGRLASEVIGLPIEILFPPYAVQNSLRLINEAIAGDRWEPVELEVAHSGGMVFTVLWNIAMVFAADGKTPIATIAQGNDITDRKLAELELQESQNRLHNIINNIPDLVWLKDREGSFVVVNEPFGRACGRKPAELTGLTDLDVWPGELAERYRRGDIEVITSGKRRQVEEPLTDQSGRTSWVETIRTPIRDEAGVIIGIAGIARDITARKRLQQEQVETITESMKAYRKLQETQQQLVQSEKLAAVGTMISGLAHELNNPLAGVIGYAELLQDAELDSQARGDLAEIVNNAMRCKKIIENLLIFSRKREPRREVCDLNEAVRQAYALKAHDIELDNIKVELALAPELPATCADIYQFEQVFLNLINNAHHALQKGEPPRRLALSSRVSVAGKLVFSVANNGPLIPAEFINKIFEPFFTTKDVGQGTGLGLAISHGIVREHGGTITVASSAAAGTVFTIVLPVDLTMAAGTADKPAAPAVAKKIRVLVIDDEAPVRKVMQRLIEFRGGEAVTCVSPAEAAGHIRAGGFDVIFCDIRFPGAENGFAVHDLFSKEGPDPRAEFVLMSGQSADPEILAEVDRRGVRFLAKPFTRDEVVGIIAGLGDKGTVT